MHGEDLYASEVISFRMPIVLPLRNAERLKAFLLRLGSIVGIQVLKMIVFLLKLVCFKYIICTIYLLKLLTTFWLELSVFVIPVETWFHIVAMCYVTI